MNFKFIINAWPRSVCTTEAALHQAYISAMAYPQEEPCPEQAYYRTYGTIRWYSNPESKTYCGIWSLRDMKAYKRTCSHNDI